MIDRKAVLVRLYPTPEQAAQMAQIAGACRFVYTLALERVRQTAGLNRAILDQGWGLFRTMLADKVADRGGRLVEGPAAHTSQTCACCGHVDAANRPSQAVFVCGRCGHSANADTNAATNILRRADGALTPVEGHRTKRPDEAGTSRRAAGCGSPEPPPFQGGEDVRGDNTPTSREGEAGSLRPRQ